MLQQAHAGIYFRPPPNVVKEFPQFRTASDYGGLRAAIDESAARI